MTLLFALESMLRLDILAWVVGLPLMVGAIWLLWYQYRQKKMLDSELAQMKKMQRYSIEYEMVIKAMKLCIWRVDVPTRAVSINSDYREFTDNIDPPSNATTETIIEQLSPEYQDVIRKGLHDVATGMTDNFHIQYKMRKPHSEESYWSETFVTIEKRDAKGKPLTLVGTTRRIDQQKEIEQALMDALFHAEESDRLKSAFLANITHEVRTPLNAIVGFSDVLPMAQSEEERNELIKLIKQNNAHLLRLFDDMVNISKLEAGNNGEIVKEDFELLPLLQEMVEKYQPVASDNGVAVEMDGAAESIIIHTDRDRLKEILNQYMNNAVKFTAAGSIRLGYDKLPSSLRIWVRDTGKGIPADKCNDRLFERFVKVDDFVAGTGLGLSICRSLADLLGGKVGVESVYQQGSTFWVEIPY